MDRQYSVWYRSILGQADTVEYVSHNYYDGCMLDRNCRLVEAAGSLLAVYNGERRGGTAATVRYARKLGRRIIILNPTTLDAVSSLEEIHTELERYGLDPLAAPIK